MHAVFFGALMTATASAGLAVKLSQTVGVGQVLATLP